MLRPTILLFDVDGTLVSTGGAGRRALDRAFQEVCGRPDALASVAFGGRTDRWLCREGLRAIDLPDDEETVDRILTAYVGCLADEVPRSDGYTVHAGVADVLSSVEGRPNVEVGLGTGNIEAGARIKLTRGDLARRFCFGGFGSDHEDRAELLRVGVRRGAHRLGREPGDCRVVVIGDTPRDVDAARAIGAECVAVATGPCPVGELRAAGAALTVDALSDPRVVPALLAEASA